MSISESPYKRTASFPYDILIYKNVDEPTRKQLRQIIDSVYETLPFRSNPKVKVRGKYREMTKNFVLNLIKSELLQRYIRISKDYNNWGYNRRYHHIHTTPTIVIKTLNELVENNWIEESKGYYNKSTELGRQTRIKPAPKFSKLIARNKVMLRTLQPHQLAKSDPKETIQLREKIRSNQCNPFSNRNPSKPVSYRDTIETKEMRLRIAQYNTHMATIETLLPLSRETIQKMEPGNTETFNNLLMGNHITLKSTIQTTKQHNTTNTPNTITHKHSHISSKERSVIGTLAAGQNHCSLEEILLAHPRCHEFIFQVHHRKMIRVFSDSGKDFSHHGRFYGDPLQNLDKLFRCQITMNGESVVECDFDSLHPTMLYIMENLEPPKNVYLYDKINYPDKRTECKQIFLISLNHDNAGTIWQVVSRQFREKLGYENGDYRLTKKYIETHLRELESHNNPIAKYMNTGVAMDLMRKDSEIADRILTWFTSEGIPIRCIHDSFIVPMQYENLLKQQMTTVFQEVMETNYSIGVSTKYPQHSFPFNYNVIQVNNRKSIVLPASC